MKEGGSSGYKGEKKNNNADTQALGQEPTVLGEALMKE